jgi:stage II sporulation protein D
MKRMLSMLLVIVVIVILVPLITLMVLGGFYITRMDPRQEEISATVQVYNKAVDKVEEMDTSEYLKEVVAAEMPADFEQEALKAQAVAARSYLLSKMENAEKNGAPQEHKGAVVCTDSTHCQAWVSEDAKKQAWGNDGEQKWKKISEAVESTGGQVLTYQKDTVSAVFFSTSSGKTEAAKDVWGKDVPYLQSVDSPGEEEAPRYHSEETISVEEFKKKAAEKIEGVDWSKPLFENIQRSGAGGILTLQIGGVTVKGTDFRTLYGLRSTNAEVAQEGENVLFKVTGNGHGVGMSQYGANAMAAGGSDYKAILTHYYTGAEITSK